jgi:hypothetical protein
MAGLLRRFRGLLLSTLAFDSRVLPTRSPRPARLRGLSLALPLLGIVLFSGCANHHFQVVAEGPPNDAPHYLDLSAGVQIATLHFPPGAYSFYAVDDAGYYYRAPGGIAEHRGARPSLHNGGIYVSKSSPKKLRGYIYIAGSLTHVGNLSHARYQFRD